MININTSNSLLYEKNVILYICGMFYPEKKWHIQRQTVFLGMSNL